MATVGKAVLVALVGAIGLVSVLFYDSYAQTVPDSPQVLPAGEELPNEQLKVVEGEQVATIVAGGLINGASDLARQGLDVLRGRRERIDWVQVDTETALGAIGAAIFYPVNPIIAKADKLINVWVKNMYLEAADFTSTEVISAVSDFINNKLVPAFSKAFYWIVDKIKP
jgi:hypothetical protein